MLKELNRQDVYRATISLSVYLLLHRPGRSRSCLARCSASFRADLGIANRVETPDGRTVRKNDCAIGSLPAFTNARTVVFRHHFGFLFAIWLTRTFFIKVNYAVTKIFSMEIRIADYSYVKPYILRICFFPYFDRGAFCLSSARTIYFSCSSDHR